MWKDYLSGFGSLGAASARRAEDGGPWTFPKSFRYITFPLVVVLLSLVSTWGEGWGVTLGVIAFLLAVQYLLVFPLFDAHRRHWERQQDAQQEKQQDS